MELERFLVEDWEMEVQEVYDADREHRLRQAFQTGLPLRTSEIRRPTNAIQKNQNNGEFDIGKDSIICAGIDR